MHGTHTFVVLFMHEMHLVSFAEIQSSQSSILVKPEIRSKIKAQKLFIYYFRFGNTSILL